MDNQTYLDQITASTKPTSSKKSFFSSQIFKIAALGVGLTIVIIIFGSILGNINNKERDLAEQLSLRMDNLTATIDEYNDSVKSSYLRSIGTSFSAILADTNRDLSDYLIQKYNFNPEKSNSNLVEKELKFADELNADLEEARLNGILDRVYVSKLDLQITLLLSTESDILSRTKNQSLQSIINKSVSSLESLQNNLAEYDNIN